MKLRCPACGAEFSLSQAAQAGDLLNLDKAAAAFGADWPLVKEYLDCFQGRREMKAAKHLRLAREVWEMWDTGKFSLGGVDYVIGREEFREALRATCNQVTPGLSNHNYLRKVLAAAAEKTSRRRERELKEREEELRATGCKPVPQDDLPEDPAWRAEFQRLLKRTLARGLNPEEKARRQAEFEAHQATGAAGEQA